MNKIQRTFILLIIIVSSGCAAYDGKPKKVVLKHPYTADFVSCSVDKWQSKESYEANERCIKEYQDRGYEIWGKQH